MLLEGLNWTFGNAGREATARTAAGMEAGKLTMKTNDVESPKELPHMFHMYNQTTELNL